MAETIAETFFIGNTVPYNLTFVDIAGAAVDISGMSFRNILKRNLEDTDAQAVLDKTEIFPTDANSIAGIGTFTLEITDTTTLPPDVYHREFRLTDTTTSPDTVYSVGVDVVEVLTPVGD